MRRIHVAVPVPALDALTYAVPSEFPDPAVGARVLVPLGNRTLTGIVVGVDVEATETSVPGLGARDSGLEGAPHAGSGMRDPGSGTAQASPPRLGGRGSGLEGA